MEEDHLNNREYLFMGAPLLDRTQFIIMELISITKHENINRPKNQSGIRRLT